jgi:aryl-alcohol dehydrogenase-like predicted oxidoreductase
MILRPLGRSGLQAAPLALGGNVFGRTADEACSLGVINFFGLARGFLTGKYRSKTALAEIAARLDATPAQVALAWQMLQPGIVAPIASATTVNQLHELLASATLTLDSAALQRLAQASAAD